ncbi:MAG: NlpC/P60 family protein, partial [Actinobacteria bacterium]|nr:NlpC/P60 family protein [Actinomycetota bacterium]
MNRKIFAIALVITLLPSTAIAATPKPTQAQIDAAKKLEAEKKAAADA